MAGPIKHPLHCSQLTHFDSIQPLLLLEIIVGGRAESKNVPWVLLTFFRANMGIHFDKDRALLSFFFWEGECHCGICSLMSWQTTNPLLGVGIRIFFSTRSQGTLNLISKSVLCLDETLFFPWKVKGRGSGENQQTSCGLILEWSLILHFFTLKPQKVKCFLCSGSINDDQTCILKEQNGKQKPRNSTSLKNVCTMFIPQTY